MLPKLIFPLSGIYDTISLYMSSSKVTTDLENTGTASIQLRLYAPFSMIDGMLHFLERQSYMINVTNFSEHAHAANPLKLCYNSKLPRCCPGDVGGAQLTCVTRTSLKFGNEVVEIAVHLNSTSGIVI